ncbi:LacI family DNA-binding transcriptional regulator [Cellulomonas sp. JZ18]|uniref:LacI family DNA-binding transcriptional regulator n=1 Tax=Cellulomonas sp. JZ18 TaxID=2654191 RepID=UPI0012D47691|nr:LacI family DNA-binding transcriptional regulator [Cellulomonas sp. JZ18]QGQ19273.1 LacI family DNA-binding transcriptional regulator [Cellulomonas sp. JZ18]
MSDDRVTSRDVARAAGVSQSTVSYVLNRTPGQSISDATRERVLSAAAELGYTPSAAAKALRSGSSGDVLVLLADGPIEAVLIGVLQTFGEALTRYGHPVVVHRRTAHDVVALVRDVRPAAVVDLSCLTPEERAAVAATGTPLVGMALDGAHDRTMHIPQDRVGALQAAHLADRGHTRIGYGASSDPRSELFMRGRLAGVRRECAARGLPEPVVVDVPLFPDAARRSLERLRQRDQPVTAVCAYDGEVALALVAAARGLGLRIPRDLALVAVDDEPLVRLALPPITTVRIRTREMGTALAQHVMRRLAPELGLPEPDDEASVVLVQRATT